MLGLRDVLFIAPTPSSLHHQQQQNQTTISSADNHHLHHHHHHHQNLPLPSSTATALGVGLGIFPLLTATPCVPQQQPPLISVDASHQNWSLKKLQELNPSFKEDLLNVGVGGDNGGGREQNAESDGDGGESGNNMRACKDCGNRAKKGCGFRRCRTCCKGRGYDCSTHVRSTWVSASRRRERQMIVVRGDGSSGSSSGAKRPRILVPNQTGTSASHASTSNANTPRSFETTSVHQDASFKQSLPGKVRSPAVFRCHRVTAINNGEAEFAYQATVRISGHVFKGFLYDQGVDEKNAFPCISPLHLEGNTISRRNGDSSSPIVAPSNAYQTTAS